MTKCLNPSLVKKIYFSVGNYLYLCYKLSYYDKMSSIIFVFHLLLLFTEKAINRKWKCSQIVPAVV